MPAYTNYILTAQFFPNFSTSLAFGPGQAGDLKQPVPDWRDAIWGKERSPTASGDAWSGDKVRAEVDQFLSQRTRGKRILG